LNYPLLALDAASGQSFASLLLSDDEALYAESEGSSGHSQSLMPMLEGLLTRAGISWKDLKMLGLGVGPGSFTGLRIAAASLAGINASLQLPVVPVSSLAVTAARAASNEALWVFEDARAGEAFVGCYHQGEPLHDEVCEKWSAVADIEASQFVAESDPPVELKGWQRLGLKLNRSEALAVVIRSSLKRVIPGDLPRYPQPVYLQMSQAEKNQLAKERAA
jgi:tRNA threonylcarbamoyl adenosine modification protein YeaZ